MCLKFMNKMIWKNIGFAIMLDWPYHQQASIYNTSIITQYCVAVFGQVCHC